MILFILALIATIQSLALADSCGNCVSSGCTYCLGNDHFKNPSICVCEGLSSGFFGGCDDFSFGSTPLNSEADCTFEKENGDVIVVVLIVISVLVCLCCCIPLFVCCCCIGGASGAVEKRKHTTSGSTTAKTTTNAQENTTGTTTQEEEQIIVGQKPITVPVAQPIPTSPSAPPIPLAAVTVYDHDAGDV